MFPLTEIYCRQIRETSYIGQKGYTILKEHLQERDLEEIKKELMKIPVVNGLPQKDLGFPIYRENAKKLYLPRFYAKERYRGMPHKSELDPSGGTTIQCAFQGTLQPHQIEAIDKYKAHILTGSPGGILELPCGYGKCLAEGTLIRMFDGTVRPVEQVRVGDLLMGDESQPRRVLTTSVGVGALYKVMGGGHEYVGNAEHILSLCRILEDGSRAIYDISIQEYLHAAHDSFVKHLLGYRVPVDWPEKSTQVPPYWMGYGCMDLKSDSGSLAETLAPYIINSRDIRIMFLAGLMDAVDDGNKNTALQIPLPHKELVAQISMLCISLGIDAVAGRSKGELMVQIRSPLPPDLQLRLRTIWDGPPTYGTMTYPIKVVRAGAGKYYGFEIDGNRRFLLSDLTVTHNTVLAIRLIADLSKKTMILVHKEFLMNQWIERIRQFMPMARVGILQGKKREWDNVDICIGMIQSIYNKEFLPGTFLSFGLTIIDEVHRIGSAEFSGVLSRIVTPLMLGISATVDRKDRLTDILYAFIGPKIHSVRRREDDAVQVRAVEFISQDEQFKVVETDYRGQVKYSTMVSKLCAFAPRSDFILRVLLDQFRENPGKQMIVLGHNRCLLVYLYDLLTRQPVGTGPTVGYYVGGMKQSQLEASETKQVVLATYAMASEALDIKTLSTLFLITPKTDIVQSVGRILRTKHNHPLIVDIVDSHPCFQNQWVKRRQYYKQCNYEIWKTNSRNYPEEWKKWSRTAEPDEEMASRVIDESIHLIDT